MRVHHDRPSSPSPEQSQARLDRARAAQSTPEARERIRQALLAHKDQELARALGEERRRRARTELVTRAFHPRLPGETMARAVARLALQQQHPRETAAQIAAPPRPPGAGGGGAGGAARAARAQRAQEAAARRAVQAEAARAEAAQAAKVEAIRMEGPRAQLARADTRVAEVVPTRQSVVVQT